LQSPPTSFGATKRFCKRWAAARRAAGYPALLFHDLRRSCVRNLERAGVSRSVAMQITGHKIISVYQRYRIIMKATDGAHWR
jgi:integrase